MQEAPWGLLWISCPESAGMGMRKACSNATRGARVVSWVRCRTMCGDRNLGEWLMRNNRALAAEVAVLQTSALWLRGHRHGVVRKGVVSTFDSHVRRPYLLKGNVHGRGSAGTGLQVFTWLKKKTVQNSLWIEAVSPAAETTVQVFFFLTMQQQMLYPVIFGRGIFHNEYFIKTWNHNHRTPDQHYQV